VDQLPVSGPPTDWKIEINLQNDENFFAFMKIIFGEPLGSPGPALSFADLVLNKEPQAVRFFSKDLYDPPNMFSEYSGPMFEYKDWTFTIKLGRITRIMYSLATGDLGIVTLDANHYLTLNMAINKAFAEVITDLSLKRDP
jgi:hypothetical protein